MCEDSTLNCTVDGIAAEDDSHAVHVHSAVMCWEEWCFVSQPFLSNSEGRPRPPLVSFVRCSRTP